MAATRGTASDIDAYLEYTRLVGDDDGGKMMSPAEYENYKKNILPIRMNNRLYTSWMNSRGMDCKLIGPETICFCGHRYRNHETDFLELPQERPIKLKCRQQKCKCANYFYIPIHGSQTIRCTCKHTSDEHNENGAKVCKKIKKHCGCVGFKSSYACGCMESFGTHKTIVQTKEERLESGKPVGHDVPYQAMGGLTGFSSLLDGYMRLDPSGIGDVSDEPNEKKVSRKTSTTGRSSEAKKATRAKSLDARKRNH